MHARFRGLVAAPFTPFKPDLTVNYDVIPTYADFLRRNGVTAAFVCGTTGEGPSLTTEERLSVVEAWLKCADERLRVIVHVGHNSLPDGRRLSAAAERSGAAAIGALAPNFFKPRDSAELVEWCEMLAGAAPRTPFYYYHLPSFTGVTHSVADFLALAEPRISTLTGVKYTYEDLADFRACAGFHNGSMDVLFGRDELLMEGWANGARGAIGSTYNYAAPLYLQLLGELQAGRPDAARRLQDKAIRMIAICNSMGVTHLAASKSIMGMLGVDCGPVRPPLRNVNPAQLATLRSRLESDDFFATACVAG